MFSALLEFAFVNYASRSDQRKGKMKRLNPLAQMMEMEEEESDSDDEDIRTRARNRAERHGNYPDMWKDSSGCLNFSYKDSPVLQHPQVIVSVLPSSLSSIDLLPQVTRLSSTDRLLGPNSPRSPHMVPGIDQSQHSMTRHMTLY